MEFPRFSRTSIVASATALSLGVTGVAAAGVLDAHRTVTLEVDGVSRQVSGFSRDVSSLLSAEGVKVASHDQVTPAADSVLADGGTVAVQHASKYSVIVDGKPVDVWSTADSQADVLADIEASGRGVIMAADRSSVRGALSAAAPGQTVTVAADGRRIPVEAAAADDVNALLDKAGVTASPLDRVTVALEAGSPVVQVARVFRGMVVEETAIPAGEERHEDPNKAQGTEEVTQEGSDGVRRVTRYQQVEGGKALVDNVISDEVVAQPTPRIVTVGTRVAPAAEYTLSQFMSAGVVNWGGYKFTYYSESVLPGGGLAIPGRHVSPEGYVCDADGYIVLAGSADKGTVYDTPFGAQGKIYDRGTTGNHLDVYVR